MMLIPCFVVTHSGPATNAERQDQGVSLVGALRSLAYLTAEALRAISGIGTFEPSLVIGEGPKKGTCSADVLLSNLSFA